MNRRLSPFWPIGLSLLAVMLLLSAGAWRQHRHFISRGIPDQLTGPIVGGGPQLGLNVALSQYSAAELDKTLAAIAETGVTTVKQPFYYSDSFDWAESDRLVTAVATHNLQLIPLLDGDPDTSFAPPENMADFANWAGDFAARYADQIDHYIIWDEPNLTSHWGNQPVNPAGYAALLTATATAVRQNDATALIIVAPLAPTRETGPQNLNEVDFLTGLYEAGAADAFDIVAAKPYGFDSGPDDRTVSIETLNFSRGILLREVLIDQGEAHKAVWAGNWGWNALPADWNGRPSIWGATTEAEQAELTRQAWQRARLEWPWMGVMFLENWEPDAPGDDPVWGFSIAGRPTADTISQIMAEELVDTAVPGFYLAAPDQPGQTYTGGWEFSPAFGADISEPLPTGPPDRLTLTFYGTDVGIRVRKADYRARLYVTVNGEPANALPRDENGTTLILTAPDANEEFVVLEPLATDLPLGTHTVEIVAERGWDQWAINGFAVGVTIPDQPYRAGMNLLLGLAAILAVSALISGRQAEWAQLGRPFMHRIEALNQRWQMILTGSTALVVALTGWLTWGEQAAGIYRRLGDLNQLALTTAVAAIFVVTPTFFVYLVALGLLFGLLYLRPAWGLALVAICFPFYVPPLLKPIFTYRFSPTEIFMLVTATAALLRWFTSRLKAYQRSDTPLFPRIQLLPADWAVLAFVGVATLSLFFTERLAVATNEWRVVIVEPALFYGTMRLVRPTRAEMRLILGGLLLGGLVVAGYGLWQYISGSDELITAEGGLLRIRSFYGSPNNVGLYLGRLLPLVLALWLLGARGWREKTAVLPLLLLFGVVTLLTFSRGAILLGVPAAFLFVFWQWQRENGRSTWPWVLGISVTGIVALVGALQIPALAGRLDLLGQTSFFRVSLWRASWQMFLDHPLIGVGLDNFLYAYRGEYILNAAWQEPDLNHPHNIFLDFGTRLGLLGLVTGGWMMACVIIYLRRAWVHLTGGWKAVGVGLGGLWVDMVMHGLVDHSFFLVDLAFVFFLLLGTAVWLASSQNQLDS